MESAIPALVLGGILCSGWALFRLILGALRP